MVGPGKQATLDGLGGSPTRSNTETLRMSRRDVFRFAGTSDIQGSIDLQANALVSIIQIDARGHKNLFFNCRALRPSEPFTKDKP
jgi:hypothetical protein